MPFVPVDGVVEVSSHAIATASGGSIPVVNTYFVRQTGGGAWIASDLDLLLATFDTWWAAEVAAVTDTSYTLVSWKGLDLTEEAGLQRTLQSENVGAREGNGHPAALCMLVTFPSDGTGKPTRHTLYHSGLVDGDQTETRWEALAVTDVGAAYNALHADLQAASPGFLSVAVSRYSGFTIATRANGTRFKRPTPRTVGIWNFVTTAFGSPNIAIQKGRRVRISP